MCLKWNWSWLCWSRTTHRGNYVNNRIRGVVEKIPESFSIRGWKERAKGNPGRGVPGSTGCARRDVCGYIVSERTSTQGASGIGEQATGTRDARRGGTRGLDHRECVCRTLDARGVRTRVCDCGVCAFRTLLFLQSHRCITARPRTRRPAACLSPCTAASVTARAVSVRPPPHRTPAREAASWCCARTCAQPP